MTNNGFIKGGLNGWARGYSLAELRVGKSGSNGENDGGLDGWARVSLRMQL